MAEGKATGGKISGKLGVSATGEPVKRKHKASRTQMFRSSIIRVAKKILGDVQVSKKAYDVLASIAYQIVEDTCRKCDDLVFKVNKNTVTGDEVYYAYDLLLKGDLKQHCLKEINEVIAKVAAKKEKNVTNQ